MIFCAEDNAKDTEYDKVLGLSIVKHAARLHNASIDLGSIPGEGSVFTVTFPAA